MVAESTVTGSVMCTVCIHDIVVCVSSSKQRCIQHACRCLNITASDLVTIASIVYIVSVI